MLHRELSVPPAESGFVKSGYFFETAARIDDTKGSTEQIEVQI
jgi:hypothetical protein